MTIDYLDRLREIDMFFAGDSPVHQTMIRLVDRLQQAGISYAVVGGMAVNAHGAGRTTKDLDVLMTSDGLNRFREQFVGSEYVQSPERSRRFVDRENDVSIDVLVTGHRPGRGLDAPFTFPDPVEASQEMGPVRVVRLEQLIQLKLAARRYYDFGDVVFLIKVHHLDEAFAEQLHPGVRSDYIECLEEKRREDQYEARNG